MDFQRSFLAVRKHIFVSSPLGDITQQAHDVKRRRINVDAT